MKKFLFIFILCFVLLLSCFSFSYAYINHCWHCDSTIDSNYCQQCSECGWYICNKCGKCNPDCSRTNSFMSSTAVPILVILGGIGFFYVVSKGGKY